MSVLDNFETDTSHHFPEVTPEEMQQIDFNVAFCRWFKYRWEDQQDDPSLETPKCKALRLELENAVRVHGWDHFYSTPTSPRLSDEVLEAYVKMIKRYAREYVESNPQLESKYPLLLDPHPYLPAVQHDLTNYVRISYLKKK